MKKQVLPPPNFVNNHGSDPQRKIRYILCQLKANQGLPLELGTLPNLSILSVKDNPLTDLPQDIVEQGNDAILEWLRDQAREQGLID